jgi:hypothetical protein
MKKILIISKVFFPNISPRANRTTQLALEFKKQGHDVTVMIPDLDIDYYDVYSQKTDIKFKSLGKLKLKQIVGKGIFKRVLSRIMLLLFEYPDIQLVRMIKDVLKNELGYDLLISIAVPHPIHWGIAAAIKNNKNLCKTWAADCGDPYMGCRTDTFKKLFYFKYFEKKWCNKCNYIVVPVNEMKYDFYPEFRNKIKIIPQGFNLNEVQIKPFKENNKVTFMYAGALSLHYRNPIPLISLLSKLSIDFKFIIYSNTDMLNEFVDLLKGKLEVRQYIPRVQLLQEMSKMDFLINFENNINENTSTRNSSSINDYNRNDSKTYSAPSKLIDYSITKRPVLSISSLLNETIIMEFINKNYVNKMDLPDLSIYDIKEIVNKFLKL